MSDKNGNVLAVKPDTTPAITSTIFSGQEIVLLRETYATGLNDTQFKVFLKQCEAMDLNPFTREIYGMVVGGRLVLITGINGFRKIAHKSGDYLGCDITVAVDADGKRPLSARATVKRLVKGVTAEFSAEVLFREFNTGKNNWASMPTAMIRKVAEATALRMAFPAMNDLHDESEVGAITGSGAGKKSAEDLTAKFAASDSREVVEHPTGDLNA